MEWSKSEIVEDNVQAYNTKLVTLITESNYFYQGAADDNGVSYGPFNTLHDGKPNWSNKIVKDFLSNICEVEDSKCDRFTVHRLK